MFFFLLIFFIKANVVGTQVNAIQMGTNYIYLYKGADRKYTECSLKIMEWLDCALTGVCVVSTCMVNMVLSFLYF